MAGDAVADPGGGGDRVDLVCSNSNFSPTGAITPPPPLSGPPGLHPPAFRKSCIRACDVWFSCKCRLILHVVLRHVVIVAPLVAA